MSMVSVGVDAVLERGPMLKEWQQVKALVEAESLEAKAQGQAGATIRRHHEPGGGCSYWEFRLCGGLSRLR